MAEKLIPLLPDSFDFSYLPRGITAESDFSGKIVSPDGNFSIFYFTGPNKYPKIIEIRNEQDPQKFISFHEDLQDQIIILGNELGQACYSRVNLSRVDSPENIDLSAFPATVDIREIGKKLWLNLELGIFEMPAIR